MAPTVTSAGQQKMIVVQQSPQVQAEPESGDGEKPKSEEDSGMTLQLADGTVLDSNSVAITGAEEAASAVSHTNVTNICSKYIIFF